MTALIGSSSSQAFAIAGSRQPTPALRHAALNARNAREAPFAGASGVSEDSVGTWSARPALGFLTAGAAAAVGSLFATGASRALRSGARARRVEEGRGRRGCRVVTLAASSTSAGVGVGDLIPDVELDLGFPPEKFPLREFCKGKKVPGYLMKEDELKSHGVTDVLIYCVNDGAVMSAWAKDQGIEGSILTFLGDTRSELTTALGRVLDAPGVMEVLGNPRCQRFSMLVEDAVVTSLNVAASESDPSGDGDPSNALVERMLEVLETRK